MLVEDRPAPERLEQIRATPTDPLAPRLASLGLALPVHFIPLDSAVPELSTTLLLGLGLVGMAAGRKGRACKEICRRSFDIRHEPNHRGKDDAGEVCAACASVGLPNSNEQRGWGAGRWEIVSRFGARAYVDFH